MNNQGQGQEQRKKDNNSKLYLVLLLILCMSVGFAVLSTTLNITGSTSIKKNTWKVQFENIQESASNTQSGTIALATGDPTRLNFSVELALPGDFYEFTVDIANKGTIDAMLTSVNKSQLTADQQKYLTYTVSYADGNNLTVKDGLRANASKKVKVRVEYNKNLNATDLPTALDSITCNLSLVFQQADSTANY